MGSDGLLLRFAIFAPIVLLIVVGGAIALRSGVGELSTGQDYLKVAVNLSHVVLRIAAYVVILIGVQYLIGMRPSLGW